MKKVEQKIIVSGVRPTGRMHLGNYHGTVKTWLELQQQHDCYFFIPDLHALTTSYQNVAHIHRDTRQMVIDWLAMGLDPKKMHYFCPI
jgi:tryptophanyl-tRNA synthetase